MPAPRFSAWLDDFFASYYRHRPVNATFIGVHEHDAVLPNFSEEGVGEVLADTRALRARLDVLPKENLTGEESLDRRLAEGFLEIQEWEYRSRHFLLGNPSLYTGEAIFSVLGLLVRDFAPLESRLAAATARLEKIPELLAQARKNVRAAPAPWTERAIRECRGAQLLFSQGLERFLGENGLEAPRFRSAAERAGRAFGGHEGYLRNLARVESVACGEEAFHLLLRRGHFLDLDAEGIERHARDALEKTTSHLESGASDLAALQEIRPGPASYMSRFEALWRACRELARENDLVSWPERRIRFVLQPAWVHEAAPYFYFLHYRSPAPRDSPSVDDYFVPSPEPEPPSEAVIKINHVVHHAALGHHVQNAFAERSLSRIGQVAGVDCASRIAFFCGGTMTEGWACYATDLMDELGFLTPLEHTAEVHARLRMAARAVVDVKLHRGEWTLEKAADFYSRRVGMSVETARSEAVKNSLFPGTALMYLMGCDQIHRLRADWGIERNQLRRFHDRILSYGSIPVSLIA